MTRIFLYSLKKIFLKKNPQKVVFNRSYLNDNFGVNYIYPTKIQSIIKV